MALYNEKLSFKQRILWWFWYLRSDGACLPSLLLATCIHLWANSKKFWKYNNIVLSCNCSLDKQYMIWNDQMTSNGYHVSGITKMNYNGRIFASRNVWVLMQKNIIFKKAITSQHGSHLTQDLDPIFCRMGVCQRQKGFFWYFMQNDPKEIQYYDILFVLHINKQIVLERCVKTILWSLLNNNQNLQSELIFHLFTKVMH